MKNIFGTDGVRGRSNDGYITPENIMKLANSIVRYYIDNNYKTVNSKFTVVIGKDTRLSGYMLEPALTSGFVASGANVVLLGPIPTPGVAFLTKSLRADLGVVISASHNPYSDNGIKFFNSDGFKISPKDEIEISKNFYLESKLTSPKDMGKAKRLDDAAGRYIEFAKNSFPKNLSLKGLKIVIDTANGASYKIAPNILWELGAEIIKIGNNPDGLNINQDCGATNTKLLQETVIKNNADIGIALDGDADRVIIVDEKGDILDGDYIIAAISKYWKDSNILKNNKIVSTIMSNLAMEKFLNSIDLDLIRSNVGDKYVVEEMIKANSNIGGEKSGHIIPIDYSSTGDGIISSLQILAYIQDNKIKISSIRDLYKPYPQIFLNLKENADLLNDENFINCVEYIKNNILKENGRIIIRKSGTENLIRIMIESISNTDINKSIDKLKEVISIN